ncbi:MAG: hypothetical protein K1X39_00475 [Thermoflexales bacterium]|nr:hypothetical protein [Thermoflexales bacterium]
MITIKGLRQGLLIILGEGAWHDTLRELEARLVNSANFFKGGLVALDVGAQSLAADDIERARMLLSSFEVRLGALITQDAGTAAAARSLGLGPTLPAPADPTPARRTAVAAVRATEGVEPAEAGLPATSVSEPLDGGTDGILARRRVRSGQVLRHPGHIVVIGDVNPGAQLIAGGDIIVWGKLQGSAHAGALGDTGAIVGALVMQPSTLRIADTQLIQTGKERRRDAGPRVARVNADGIEITIWQEK